MWYVYDKATTQIVKQHKTRAAAQAAITRAHKQYLKTHVYYPGSNAADDDPLFKWAMADSQYFHTFIEQRRFVKNLMTGATVEITANTPRSCDPSSELYWSM
jgi:hypothetical protein